MSATVAAALKKIAVALLTNPKVIKTIGGVVLGIIIIIIMPIVAVVSIFNGDIEIDTDRLQTMVVENLSAEEQAKLQFVEDTMLSIESEMQAAGFGGRVKEAQVLYVLALSDHASESGFVSKLVGCFTADQTDEQLIESVNSAFGTQLTAEDFGKVMGNIRAVYIDTSGYTDPTTKNNLDLVQWAIEAEKSGWGYVWGTYGDVFDQEMFDFKLNQYPDEVGGYEEFIRQNWLGSRTADCVGLIKGYGWLNADSHEVEYGTNGMVLVFAFYQIIVNNPYQQFYQLKCSRHLHLMRRRFLINFQGALLVYLIRHKIQTVLSYRPFPQVLLVLIRAFCGVQ